MVGIKKKNCKVLIDKQIMIFSLIPAEENSSEIGCLFFAELLYALCNCAYTISTFHTLNSGHIKQAKFEISWNNFWVETVAQIRKKYHDHEISPRSKCQTRCCQIRKVVLQRV